MRAFESPNCPNELSPIANKDPASVKIRTCALPHAIASILLIWLSLIATGSYTSGMLSALRDS